MRPLFLILYPAALLLSTAAPAAADFAPNPRQAFEGYVGINPPRADVPVGALWIKDYGPVGEAAAADNLETVRSLNALSIDKNLQLALSVGLFNLLGIDPKARNRYTAKFSELSIVRVKDVARLAGTKGEPRIVAALKAGSVMVSSDSAVSLSGQSIGLDRVQGSTANERSRNFAFEARDMYIAIRVATPEVTKGEEQELRMSKDGKSARLDDFLVVVSKDPCAPALPCFPRLGVAKLNSQTVETVASSQADEEGSMVLDLPVPIADGSGGIFDRMRLRWIKPCVERKVKGCAREPRLFAQYRGTRLADVPTLHAKDW